MTYSYTVELYALRCVIRRAWRVGCAAGDKDCHAPQIRPKQVVECVKDDFHRFRVKSSHFPENRIITFSTAARDAKEDCHGPEKRQARFGHELWSNRVHDTALGGNPCCTFAFLATFSLPRCRRKLRHTRQLPPGGRARPDRGFRINHTPGR